MNELLQASPELREEFADQIQLDQMLVWSFSEHDVDYAELLLSDVAGSDLGCQSDALSLREKLGDRSNSRRRSNSLRRLIGVGALLSLLLCFIVVSFVETSSDPVVQQTPVAEVQVKTANALNQKYAAVLLDTEDAVWDGDDVELPFGKHLFLGERLSLKSGIARLAFANGAGVVLEGPAELELCSLEQACLNFGKLAAVVPEAAKNFSVSSKSILIKDLGTRYGATVNPDGDAHVDVFEGEVTLEAGGDHNSGHPSSDAVKVKGPRRIHISNTGDSRITVGSSSSGPDEYPDVPNREQLAAAKSGVYPPVDNYSIQKDLTLNHRHHSLGQRNEDFVGSPFLYADQFNYFGLALDNFRGGWGFGPHAWEIDRNFVNCKYMESPLLACGVSGGDYSLELSGRHPAYPAVATRLSRKLINPLNEEFFFSFIGKYDGLDEDDFFSLWFDNRHRLDDSHARCPNVGIKNGTFFVRLEHDFPEYGSIPVNGESFFIVGKLSKANSRKFNQLSLWCNPDPLSANREADVVVELKGFTDGPQFESVSVLGIRMGSYTEQDDRFLVDRLVIGTSYEQVAEQN
ncbi:hypothetical protein [Calycomorphotria hydatis]|uniref:hypothetical protein n=1 Tax=Calycomorphotria hydatis TaxID=2528027 RepID=UPI0011A165AB|nr:hypothetical protein [Calycomorphotria hydatis]